MSLRIIRGNEFPGYRLSIGTCLRTTAIGAWGILSDPSAWKHWGPAVTAVDYDGGRLSEDTEGLVQLFGLFWVPFRIESVEEFYWSWSMVGFTPPAIGHRVEELESNQIRVSFELPLWAFWYLPICHLALTNIKSMLNDSPSK